MRLILEAREEMTLQSFLAQILGAELNETIEQKYPELVLILKRIMEESVKNPDFFKSENFGLTLDGLDELSDFIDKRVLSFCKILREGSKYAFTSLKSENSKGKIQSALRLVVFMAFLGHLGVQRRELDGQGKPMDYFLHPLFAAFYEFPEVVGLQAWRAPHLEGLDSERLMLGEVMAVLLHDLFEDVSKGQLIQRGVRSEDLITAFERLLQEDVPELLGIEEPLRGSFGNFVLNLVRGVTKKKGGGRLQSTLKQVSALLRPDGLGIWAVKLADRAQNANTLGVGGESFRRSVIQAETCFYADLATAWGNRVVARKLSFLAELLPVDASVLYQAWLDDQLCDLESSIQMGLGASRDCAVVSTVLVNPAVYQPDSRFEDRFDHVGIRVLRGTELIRDNRFEADERTGSLGSPFLSGRIKGFRPYPPGLERVQSADATNGLEAMALLFGAQTSFTPKGVLERDLDSTAQAMDKAIRDRSFSEKLLWQKIGDFYLQLRDALLT